MIERVAGTITRTICIVVFALTAALLLYWFTDPNKLPPFLLIKANTAFSLFLSSISLWYLRKGPDRTGYIFSAVVTLIGALTLLQYILEIDFGIDQILVSDVINQESRMYPGRMSPIAAFCLTLVGSALLLIDYKTSRRRQHLSSFFLMPVLFLSFLAIVGYAYGITSFYTVGPFIRIALPTTVLLGAICVGMICARPTLGPFSVFFSDGIGGMMARRFLPPIVFLPAVLGWFRLEGQRLGYIDVYMGVAILVVTFTVLFCFFIGFQGANLNSLDIEREEKFRQLADSMPQIVWMANSNGRMDYANERWYEFTGFDRNIDINESREHIFHPDDLNRFRSAWLTAVTTGQPYQAEYRFKNKMGGYRWFLSRALPVKNEKGRVIRWFGTSTDIDIQKQNEIDLAEAIFSRDEFISIASHELKTPITSLKLQIQMLQRSIDIEKNRLPPVEKLAKSLEITSRQSRRLEGLVEELLDVTRARAGKLKFQFEDFDLSELVSEILERLRHQIQEAKIELRLVLTPGITGHWDRSRLDQVIVNLIINSIKYAPGKPVTIRTGNQKGAAYFSIKDEGPGIPKEKQHLIFQRFERVTDSDSVAGLGLGLFLVKQIVDGHRGEIKVESEIGRGTLFTVSLPPKAKC